MSSSNFKALVKLIFRVNDESKLVHILKLSLWQKFLALGESFFVGIAMLYGDTQLWYKNIRWYKLYLG